jgi:hypothetical protein
MLSYFDNSIESSDQMTLSIFENNWTKTEQENFRQADGNDK